MVYCEFFLHNLPLAPQANTSHSKYLSDPTEDVKVATENILAEFLKEIRDIAILQRRRDEAIRVAKYKRQQQQQQQVLNHKSSKGTLNVDVEKIVPDEKGAFISDGDGRESLLDAESIAQRDSGADVEEGNDRDTGGRYYLEFLLRRIRSDIKRSLGPRTGCIRGPRRHR